MKTFTKKISLFGYVVALLTTITSIISVMLFNAKEWIFSEAGIIENTQWVLIVCAMLVYLIAAFDNSLKSKRMIYFFLAALCYLFLVREVDFEKLNLPSYIEMFLYGKGRAITVTIAMSIPIICAAMKFNHYKKESINLLLSREGIILFCGGLLLGLGSLFEHQSARFIGQTGAELLEELSELWGYAVILFAAASSTKTFR